MELEKAMNKKELIDKLRGPGYPESFQIKIYYGGNMFDVNSIEVNQNTNTLLFKI